jgi:hypothetical protein
MVGWGFVGIDALHASENLSSVRRVSTNVQPVTRRFVA